jgi:hypothetical protein
MLGMQKLFDRLIRERTEPARVLHQLILTQLDKLGVEHTSSQDAHLYTQCQNLKNGSLTFDFDDDQLIAAGYTNEEDLRKILQEFFDDLPRKIDELIEKLGDALPAIIDKSSEEVSRLLVAELKSRSREMLRDQRNLHQQFTRNNYRTWKDALDHLEMVIVSAFEAGEQFNEINRAIAAKTNDIAFDMLCRLHARACLVSKEILLLLKHGYPDGAHARWRSLHEIVVVAALISAHGSNLAERYALHDAVESYKAAQLHQKYASVGGYEPIDGDEFERIVSQYTKLIEKYGKSYHHEYGWASAILEIPKPSFVDIERAVNLSHYRPLYKLASHNIHANPKGAFFKLGLLGNENVFLAGPSNVGLLDPGQSTARSLLQITSSFVLREPTLDFIVVCKTITRLVEETEDSFLAVTVKQETSRTDK